MSTKHHVAAHGQDCEAHEDRGDKRERREEMHHGVGAERNDIFLGERLDAVGDWLEKAIGANAVGAETVLNAAQAFALKDSGERKKAGKDADDGDDAEQ